MRVSTTQFSHEFLPAPYKPTSAPLMVVLHGRGDSLKPFRGFREELGLRHLNLLLLNAPRRYDGGYTWYGFPPRQAKGVLDARNRLNVMMEELEEQGIQSGNVFFFGFSQGCLVSCDFGLQYPKPLGGIIGVSGYLYFFEGWKERIPKAAYRTPWLITHGLRDSALNIDTTRSQVEELVKVGLPLTWHEYDKDHEIEELREIPRIRDFVRSHSRSTRRPIHTVGDLRHPHAHP